MFDLFPHQKQIITDLREGFRAGHLRQMLAAATAVGKTVIAAHLIKNSIKKGRKAFFIVHQKQLVTQAVTTFSQLGLKVGIIQGENTSYHSSHDVIVACVASLRNRPAPEWVDFCLIDEAHILWEAHIELMQRWNALPFIGLSATPLRSDLGKYFTNLVRGPSIQWLMDHGYLVPVKAFCPGVERITGILNGIKMDAHTMGEMDFNQQQLADAMNQPHLIGDIVSTWLRLGGGRQTICFPVNKAHSRAIVEAFQSIGIAAAHIEDKTTDDERKGLFAAFNRNEIRILSSVGVLSVGFDSPIASCGILARPTGSLALDIQQKGRLLRTCDGKTDSIILDHAGNCLRHGLPQHFEVPDLNDGKHEAGATKKKSREPKVIVCMACEGVIPSNLMTCAHCGTDRPRPQSNVIQLPGELVEYGQSKNGKEQFSEEEKQRWYQGFLWYAEKHNHKPGTAYYRFQEKFGIDPPYWWKNLPPLPPDNKQMSWIKGQNIRFAKSKKKAAKAQGTT